MTLGELLAHGSYPFADFRRNDGEFLLLELYWAALAQTALGDEVSAQIRPLQAAEQDRDNEGDPVMLDAWLPATRRGLRIVLMENVDDLPYCEGRTDKIGCYTPIDIYCQRRGVTAPDDEIDQIVLRADMSDLARDIAIAAIRRFLIEGADPATIEAEWDDYLARSGLGPTNAHLKAQADADWAAHLALHPEDAED